MSAMNLTPCNPTMIQAKEAIIAADQQLSGGLHACKLWSVFASRLMGVGASSPNHSSTTTIVTSNKVPDVCLAGVTFGFASTDVPKNIPDNNATGVTTVVNVPAGPPRRLGGDGRRHHPHISRRPRDHGDLTERAVSDPVEPSGWLGGQLRRDRPGHLKQLYLHHQPGGYVAAEGPGSRCDRRRNDHFVRAPHHIDELTSTCLIICDRDIDERSMDNRSGRDAVRGGRRLSRPVDEQVNDLRIKAAPLTTQYYGAMAYLRDFILPP